MLVNLKALFFIILNNIIIKLGGRANNNIGWSINTTILSNQTYFPLKYVLSRFGELGKASIVFQPPAGLSFSQVNSNTSYTGNKKFKFS
jgi:hypothetical protein